MSAIIFDHDTIGRASRIISGREHRHCIKGTGESIDKCWCFDAGPDGSKARCPEDLGTVEYTPPAPSRPLDWPTLNTPWFPRRS